MEPLLRLEIAFAFVGTRSSRNRVQGSGLFKGTGGGARKRTRQAGSEGFRGA